MNRYVKKMNGVLWDLNNEKEFKGQPLKDMEKGDVFETVNNEGQKVKKTIVEKQTDENGFIIVFSSEVKI